MKQLLVGLLLMFGHFVLRANSLSHAIQEIDSLRISGKKEVQESPNSHLYNLGIYKNIHLSIMDLPVGTYPMDSLYDFYFKEALPLIDQLLPFIKTKQERWFFFTAETSLLEGALNICHQLHQKTKNPKYLQDAFDLLEKQKFPSRQLPDILPPELSAQLRQQESQLLVLEDSIRQIGSPEMRRRKSELHQKLSILHQKIRTKYPEYAAFLELHQMVALDDFQKLLAPDEAVIQYFFGNQAIYALVIQANHAELYTTAISNQIEVKQQLELYLEGLKEPGHYNEMVPAAHRLYQWLLQPMESNLRGVEKVTIIPDLALQAIPFETLLKKLPKTLNSDYAQLDYMILHHQFVYNRSSTQMALHLRPDALSRAKPKVVAFAPGFDQQLHRHFKKYPNYLRDQNYLQLDSLTHLTRNLDWLNTNLQATTYKWEEANISNFKEHSQADILHLGTHIIFNPDYLMQSKIVLAKEIDSSGLLTKAYLSLKDLYYFQLDMDLAVLAGCTSGKDGFGFAYGFESAGISSTLYSLWKINDKESAQIIQLFYQHLQMGSPTGKALHLAKRDYLRLSKDLKLAPKYWAAFVLNGDSQTFAFEKPKPARSYPLWASIGLCFLLGLLLYFRKKRSN